MHPKRFRMPIFEYKCLKCDAIFEHLVIPTSKGPAECPLCHSKGKHLEPVISMFSTKNDAATRNHMNWVKKESKNMRYEQHQMEKRLAHDD